VAAVFLNRKIIIIGSLILNTFLFSFYSYGYVKQQKFVDNSDKILLKDLADKLNPLLKKGDKVLIYEIQAQFYLKGNCLSIDGLIGGQLKDVIRNKITYADFIRTNKVKYVVTNGDLCKKSFSKNTLLEKLYNYDLNSNICDTVTIEGIKLKKILVNDYYNTTGSTFKTNSGEVVRNYSNEWILWDSVFEIL
jgi:hypothetical protein